MFVLSHTYISTKLTNREDPLLIFGSVLPDIATTSLGKINRELIHNSPFEFYEFINKHYQQLTDLGLGVLLHSDKSRGADYYSDDHQIGYAYIKGRLIHADVAKLLDIPEDSTSLVFAHNVVENALDLLLAKNIPDILSLYKNSLEKISPQVIARPLSHYLDYDRQKIENEVDSFKLMFSADFFVSTESMADYVVIPFLKKYLNKDVDQKRVKDILNKTMVMIEESYLQFLEKTVQEMKNTFSKYI